MFKNNKSIIYWRKKLIKDKSIIFFKNINKKYIKKINKKYRNKNKPTDVLSFNGENNILGNILFSPQMINKKDKDKIIIHAILHLLNYNHEFKKDEKIMINIEEKIGMSGIEPPTITTSK